MNKTIGQIDVVAAKAMVQAILVERGDGDELTRYRGDKTVVRPRLGTTSPSYTFTDEIKNIFHNCKAAKAENILGRQPTIQAEHESTSKP